VLIYDNDGQLVATVRKGMAAAVNGVKVTLVDVVGSTGLQIKADPGIPLVYGGFGLLMLGVIMSYVSHSQVWALEQDGTVYVGGRTNRAQVTFERELLALLANLPERTEDNIAEPHTLVS
ncbi:MAG: cytochrome c biogenesis protein ResB, partial [Cyanobacteria bacterium J06638_6]